jgi:hypothetical protein
LLCKLLGFGGRFQLQQLCQSFEMLVLCHRAVRR